MERDAAVKVGLVGAGNVSAYHARALGSLPFVEIAGVADPDQERAKALAAKFKIPRVFPSLAAMAEAQPNVIHVLTPPATHTALVLEALEMGCHVFVEKPMAETAADCDRMIAAARERNLVLSVNHSARMDPIVLRALERLRRGACGEITGADFFCSSDYPSYGGGTPLPAAFRNGSYPFQDLGVHGLCLLEAILGPIQHADIRYYASGMGDSNLVFDEWRGLVECQKGTGQMYLSWNVRPMQNEVIVHGTRGVMHIDRYLQTLSVRKTYRGPKPVQRILGAGFNSLGMLFKVAANSLRFATGRLVPNPGIQVSVVKFHEALRKGEAPPVPPEEGRRVIALLEDVSKRADADKHLYLAEHRSIPAPRVLVTGAHGMLGQALVRRLREFPEPLRLAMRRPPEKPPGGGVEFVFGDLGDPEFVDRAVEGTDVVFHLGAAMRGGLAEFTSGTVWGTRNIVDACERHGVRRLVHVSSMTVLHNAGHLPDAPVTESFPYEPHASWRGLYTQTKLEAEKTVLQAVEENRIHAVVLRPGQIYGPGAEKAPPAGTITVGDRWLVVGSGSRYVPLVYVDNVVDALLLAAQEDLPNGSIFQLVDPDGIRQKEYVEWVKRAGRPVRVWYVPAWVLKCAGGVVVGLAKILRRPPPLSPYRVKSIVPLWPCYCTAAHTKLGWKPRYSLQEGMRITFPPVIDKFRTP